MKAKRTGFTLLELVIVLAVMTILSGILIPVVKQILDSAKVTKVVSLVDGLTNACRRFYRDTHKYALEYGDSTDATKHLLAYNPNTLAPPPFEGWNGPYIDAPLLNSALPYEGTTILLKDSLDGVGNGYLLAGFGGPTTQGSSNSGQEILITGISEKWVKKIDEAFDGSTTANSNIAGRVVYAPAALGDGSYFLAIFVFDPIGIPK